MKFEEQFNNLLHNEGEQALQLDDEKRRSIEARADMRRRGQKFKVDAMNLESPTTTNEAMKITHEKMLSLVFREANGEMQSVPELEEVINQKVGEFTIKAEQNEKLFPNLSAYNYAQGAKVKEGAGKDFQDQLERAKKCAKEGEHISKNSPTSLLPDAIMLGIQTRQTAKSEMPSKEEIAEIIINDTKLLYDYALVLPEEERAEFLIIIPEEKRRLVSQAFDSAVSEVLHQSLVEKKSKEDFQRSRVRGRLFGELRDVVEKGDAGDKQIAKILAHSIGALGEDTRQLLLEIMREEVENKEKGEEGEKSERDHLPRVMKVFLDNFDDYRGNDIALKVAGDKNTNRHIAIFLLGKLIANNYIPNDVKSWWDEQKNKGEKGLEGEKLHLEIIQSVIADLGVVPSKEILTFVADNAQWGRASIAERIETIKSSQKEFADITDNHELTRSLKGDERKAMMYYLLHGGDDRFNLINNYSFDKFKEMIGLIDDLKINEKPLQEFQKSLTSEGVGKKEVADVLQKLRAGKYPLENTKQATQEISFDVSENASIKNANFEIGGVMGRQQLGVVLLFPLYREFLEKNNDAQAGEIVNSMKDSKTFRERLAIIDRIEVAYPNIRAQAIEELQDDWKALGEKMVLELSLEQVFGQDSVAIRGEELIPRLDAKRIDLKKIKKDLLVMLKGTNKQTATITKELAKKRKAREGLLEGMERQEDEAQKQNIKQKIEKIEEEMKVLEHERALIGDHKTADRFAHLSEDEKKEEIEKIGNEILALTEKSPSAIFTYITMQALGEERLRENDVALIQEMESHLQGPFQSIVDTTTYQKPFEKEEKKRMKINLEYLDKTERFMNMVRFADSKICCFSSNNYEQNIAHGTPNKYWVASINADPLSFVLSMEMPVSASEEEIKKSGASKENLGFIFGSFALDEQGKPAIMLNGIYYAPGVENKEQVEMILSGVEKVFEGLPIKTIAIAQQHGGSLGKDKMPKGYKNDSVGLTRLRALDDGYGNPETKIYDDLGTGSNLNKEMDYSVQVWHKDKKP